MSAGTGPADWGTGRYERTAAQLEPAADAVVSVAAPQAGERVLDLACGTGNAALRVARLGISAYGIELVPRLIGALSSRPGSSRLRPASLPGT